MGKLVHVGPELAKIAQTSLKAWNKKKAGIILAQYRPSPPTQFQLIQTPNMCPKHLRYCHWDTAVFFRNSKVQGTMQIPPMSRSKCLTLAMLAEIWEKSLSCLKFQAKILLHVATTIVLSVPLQIFQIFERQNARFRISTVQIFLKSSTKWCKWYHFPNCCKCFSLTKQRQPENMAVL